MDRMLARLAAIGLATVSTFGCGGSSEEAPPAAAAPQANAAQVPTPDHNVAQFLEAVRTGDDKRAGEMLTDLARKKTAEYDIVVAPSGSDTAKFKVGELEYLSDDAAHVWSTWSDVGPEGETHADDIIWVLKREPVGWRIAGMITKVFPDMDPIALNFENPEEMQQKQELAEKEIRRRAEQAARPASPLAPPVSTR